MEDTSLKSSIDYVKFWSFFVSLHLFNGAYYGILKIDNISSYDKPKNPFVKHNILYASDYQFTAFTEALQEVRTERQEQIVRNALVSIGIDLNQNDNYYDKWIVKGKDRNFNGKIALSSNDGKYYLSFLFNGGCYFTYFKYYVMIEHFIKSINEEYDFDVSMNHVYRESGTNDYGQIGVVRTLPTNFKLMV